MFVFLPWLTTGQAQASSVPWHSEVMTAHLLKRDRTLFWIGVMCNKGKLGYYGLNRLPYLAIFAGKRILGIFQRHVYCI